MPASYGMYVDMDGSTSSAGRMETNTSFNAGQYVLSFDVGGSQRGDTNVMDVYFGGFLFAITLNSSDPFTHFTTNQTLAAPATLVFDHHGGDNYGLFLDNLQVQQVQQTPLPSTVLLLGSGLAGLGFLRRKWNLKK